MSSREKVVASYEFTPLSFSTSHMVSYEKNCVNNCGHWWVVSNEIKMVASYGS